MQLPNIAAVALGLLLAAWTIAAAFIALSARARFRQAEAGRAGARRLARMIETGPAAALLVKGDGSIEGSDRLAVWLGFERLPGYLSELRSDDAGFSGPDLERLSALVRRAQKTAAPFRMDAVPVGSDRSLSVRGQYADDMIAPGGAALVWFFDVSENLEDLRRMREELDRANADFGALTALIEAAPLPMWFRDRNLALRLVNTAYVEAVGADSGAAVLGEQVELVEPSGGRTAAAIAGQARDLGKVIDRRVHATIGGQRRALRVVDLPIAEVGVAGFAEDLEQHEDAARSLRAAHDTQIALMDVLSCGVARFGADRRLIYSNAPFRRIFALPGNVDADGIDFHRFLDVAREANRLPETADFPAWRVLLGEWFGAGRAAEEAWVLPGGTHLRIAGLPSPDGGLTLMAEDRSEKVALSATRDTLLKARDATLEGLFEAIAIFSPDGRLQTANSRFARMWTLPEKLVSEQPLAEDLLGRMARSLADDAQRERLGEAIRGATLERREERGVMRLHAGGEIAFAAAPLPDGNGLIAMLPVGEQIAPVEPDEPRSRGEAQVETADPPPAIEEIEFLPFLTALVRQRESDIEAKDITFNLRAGRNLGGVRHDRDRLGRGLGMVTDAVLAATPAGGRVDMVLKRRASGVSMMVTLAAKVGAGDDWNGADLPLDEAGELIGSAGGRCQFVPGDGGGMRVEIELP